MDFYIFDVLAPLTSILCKTYNHFLFLENQNLVRCLIPKLFHDPVNLIIKIIKIILHFLRIILAFFL